MATLPTRLQQQARDRLADALLATAEASRLDGTGRLDDAGFREIATRLASISSAFSLDEIVARALDSRVKALKLPTGSADLIGLNSDSVDPLLALRLDDLALGELVGRLEEELGGL